MLDAKFIRANPQVVAEGLAKRRARVDLEEFRAEDARRRELLAKVESLKSQRNQASQEIAARKKTGQAAQDMIEEMRVTSETIKDLDGQVKESEERLQEILLSIPNLPHASVPFGEGEADNPEVRAWGEPRQFHFEPLSHWELGEKLDILDFARGGKVAGARFTFLKGNAARLERALINLMLDQHTSRGYHEIFPPYMVNSDSMRGTGQLPKFAEDMFKVANTDYYLIPTAEVPVTNLYRDEILGIEDLPRYHVAYSACFRAEAGAAGRDTRGLIRQHQFNKVELVKFSRPEESYEELEKLTADAEHILQILELPYRVVVLCGADLGFSAAKTYDLEVWLPSSGTYREISSCSNFEDYQARRANIRYRQEPKAKPQFVHTLNGSGVAVGRTLAALLENHQQPDGSIYLPPALRPYLAGAASLPAVH